MQALKNNKLIQGGVAVAVLALLYWWYSLSGSGAPLVVATPAPSPVSQEILLTLGSLHTITLDPALFADPLFASLVDSSTVLPPQTSGRRNPFAPIGSQ